MPGCAQGVAIDSALFIDNTARLYGNITLSKGVSIWHYAVIRAELHSVAIGARSNIQDFVMIHAGFDHPVAVGEDYSIAHHATLHGCTIGSRTLVGINATVLDGAVIGDDSIVAPHALVREGDVFPDKAIIAGIPARCIKVRDCGTDNLRNARFYLSIGQDYGAGRPSEAGARFILARASEGSRDE